MTRVQTLLAALAACVALPAFAHDGVHVEEAYIRVSSPSATSGGAFMVIENHGGQPDRLISAASDVAERVELHTHAEEDGVMRMIHVEEGFEIPAGETRALARGGDHVMLLGLTRPLAHGDVVQMTLTFEREGEVALEIPVDLERKPDHGGGHGHGHGGSHGH